MLSFGGDTSTRQGPDSSAPKVPSRRRAVMTSGKIWRVPNQPKTPKRSIRVPDALWAAAIEKAEARGEVLAEEIRKFLERYVRRRDPK